MKMTLDTREFSAAMKFVIETTGKDSADVLNRAGRNVTLRAMSFTPFVPLGRIRAELTRQARRKRGKRGGILARKDGKIQREFKASLLVYSIINARRRAKGSPAIAGQEMSTAAQRFIRKRLSSSKYIRAGFIPAALKFGLNPTLRVSPKGYAGRGLGKKATPKDLIALIVNRATAAEKIAFGPLQRAVAFVIKDMVDHAKKTYQATFDRVKP